MSRLLHCHSLTVRQKQEKTESQLWLTFVNPGSIEQDADVVMLMSRYYDKEKKEEDRNRIILNVAKQRNGPVGEVELVWLPQFTKFEDAEQPGDRI